MSERVQEAALGVVTTLGLALVGLALYHLDAHEAGMLVLGAAIGHAAPRRRKPEAAK